MKKLFIFSLVILAITTMSSCLGDSNNNQTSTYHTLTAAERSAILQKIYNSYTGKVKYVNSTGAIDSIPSTLSSINDSTMMLDFPVSILANYLTYPADSTVRKELQQAPNQALECSVQVPYYVYTTYWDEYYSKGIYPELAFYPKSKTMNITSGSHFYELTFSYEYIYYQNSNVTPVMQYFSNKVYAFLLLTSLKVDGTTIRYINCPAEFIGTTK